MTNSDLIRDALGLIGVLNEIQNPSAEQGAHGLRVMNELLADWEQDGVDLQYYPQTSLTDPLPFPDHAISAVKYYLAFALAPYYGRKVSPEMVATGQKFYNRLIRDSVTNKMQEADMSNMPSGEGHGGYFDITTG